MFCPQCGQQQVSGTVRFCSRCGFPMDGVIQLLSTGGMLPVYRSSDEPVQISPRRKGVKQGGFSLRSSKPVTWQDTPENVGLVQNHMVQFLSLATGGPAKYEGKEMKTGHADMHISNPEFDAAVGDLKASLDKLQVPNKEQKELLSIIESTRPQIVTER